MEQEITLTTIDELNSFISKHTFAVVYFSHEDCNVCKVLKPKLKAMLAEEFPQIQFAYVNLTKSKELAAQNSIFTVPTILFYIEGKEFMRKARNVNLSELHADLERPYSMLFS